MFRWAARFLLLVVLAPVYGPAAMAYAMQPAVMHCMRQSMSADAQPEMPCHHKMAQSKASGSEACFQAADNNCCPSHCCCGATTSASAEPASNLLSRFSLLIEPAQPAPSVALRSGDRSGRDSARAPPRS
jgi:hypothetical protein